MIGVLLFIYLFLFYGFVSQRCRSNLLGTHFTLFDNGENPRRHVTGARQELVAIAYVSISADLFAKGTPEAELLTPL